MLDYRFYDINKNICTEDISLIFPNWKGEQERVAVFGPHDDDALIGASYAIRSAAANGAQVYVVIFCSGNAGYTKIEEKDSICGVRKLETEEAYGKIGVPADHIIFFDYSDFSAAAYIGWQLDEQRTGTFPRVIRFLREKEITRLLIPNHYREHADHTAVSEVGMFDAPQATDPILPDWGRAVNLSSVMEYSVWADFSPEDMMLSGRTNNLRANLMIGAPEAEEKIVREGIEAYRSQGAIIKDLVNARETRRTGNGTYLELYLALDPRPKLQFAPYIEFAEKLQEKEQEKA